MQQLQMRLPEVFRDDVQKFQAEIDRLHRGEITRAQFRSFRVPMGVYEQRESDTYMLRVRFPAGGVLPHQMRALAKASRQYGAGVLHVTSRQDIQIHRVLLDDIPKAFAVLAEAGLSTRGGGGNTVRNITGCVHAGVCPEEEFDITPYAIALTEFLIGDPLSYQLPRKYKIAFSGCSQDCAGVAVNDVGFVARRRNGQIGFAVYVGGGMGAHSRVGELLEEFVPADQIHLIAEAVKRVFDQHGNRRNRAKARLRFLIEKIGLEGFRKLYEAELQRLREQNVPPLEPRPVAEPDRRPAPPATSPAPEFDAWRRVNTTAQKQPGFWIVHIPLRLGDITADTMEQLADVVERFGEGAARTTQDQNLVLRWVTEEELPALHAELSRLGLARTDAPVLRNMIACAGAATCRLGICLSRGLADAVCRALERNAIDLEKLGNLRVYISGCPNACGRHPIGDVSLSGAARRVKSRLVPHYVVRLGGRVGEGTTRLADGKMTLPARNVPAFLTDFLEAFQNSDRFPDFNAFLETGGREAAEQLAEGYKEVPDFQDDKNYYYDWGAEELFSLAGRGPGECGAGVFELIEVDLASAREALEQEHLWEATVLAARALLITRGHQGRDDADVLRLFREHFLQEKLVESRYEPLIDLALEAAQTDQPQQAFSAAASEVADFVDRIHKLYDSLDSSLRFKPAADALEKDADEKQPAQAAVAAPNKANVGAQEAAAEEAAGGCGLADPTEREVEPAADVSVDREEDFRGVVCPLNYVKTKMVLDRMKPGEVLSVVLDRDGAANVPESAEKDGHQILAVRQRGGHWQVLIRRK